ncbi:hypothetical protein JQS43_21890 [Natronosporangium hydrolyticum]|uniref:Uncharacterized protein n=1 Tax=Natronosporangium hydrolyticum TaxID=2811111 RepID=A0A895YK13_9ACTN|nr:hypothetical protein [Natronosporangium hydrolyticum]QSB14148.1 hypothetical protein JQS43_21890 [Natronosporangium hydrolyticum]
MTQGHLGQSHPLAVVASRHCRHGVPVPLLVGGVACGACWELAIRDDERVVVEHGLPRELVPDPDHVDEVAVRLACRGEPVELTAAERAEAARVLAGRGVSAWEIRRRLRQPRSGVVVEFRRRPSVSAGLADAA